MMRTSIDDAPTTVARVIELHSGWKAALADDDLRRQSADPAFDDSAWESVVVPDHWRLHPGFAVSDGPLLYRHRFETPRIGTERQAVANDTGSAHPASPDTRWWLQFDGIFYQGDIWLDGEYLGDTEGYFAPHSFEITDHLARRSEHLLSVEVACAPQKNRSSKRNLTGVFQHWDCIHPDWNPGGIWQPVRLVSTGSVRIERVRVLCVAADQHRATLAIRANLDTLEARSVTVDTAVFDADQAVASHTQVHPLGSGMNRVEWQVTVDRPTLWWPRSLGSPNMVDVRVAVSTADGAVTDRRQRRTGLRQVRQRDWVYEVNGERLHLKGANVAPVRMALGNVAADEARALVQAGSDAGLDLLRVHAHISHPDLYVAADEAGMLLWQDLPLQWGYSRAVRKPAVEQAREAVELLGHHPSIIQWSGHNEPLALDIEPGESLENRKRAANMVGRYLAAQQLPTWNKSILDFAIHRSLTRSDPSRPVSAHSGILPGPLSSGSDTHVYFGWYHGHERDFPKWLRRVPRLARFVSEFGAQAMPVGAAASFAHPERWPNLDWDHLAHVHALQISFMDRHVARDSSMTFEEWALASQRYQALVLRRHIHELRRLKYRPNGGFTMFSLNDPLDHPAATWSVISGDGTRKLGYAAVAEACAPVIVVADRLPATLAAGSSTEVDIHVVSDLRATLRNAVVQATLTIGSAQPLVWTWSGDCPADHVTRVGAVPILIPVGTVGGTPVKLSVTMEHDRHQPTCADDSVVAT